MFVKFYYPPKFCWTPPRNGGESLQKNFPKILLPLEKIYPPTSPPALWALILLWYDPGGPPAALWVIPPSPPTLHHHPATLPRLPPTHFDSPSKRRGVPLPLDYPPTLIFTPPRNGVEWSNISSYLTPPRNGVECLETAEFTTPGVTTPDIFRLPPDRGVAGPNTPRFGGYRQSLI